MTSSGSLESSPRVQVGSRWAIFCLWRHAEMLKGGCKARSLSLRQPALEEWILSMADKVNLHREDALCN